MIHVETDNLGVTGVCDYGPQNEIEAVDVSAQEEVCWRAEIKIFSSEEPVAGPCPELPDTPGNVRFSSLKHIFDIVCAKEIFIS